jgi:hypothetical protein
MADLIRFALGNFTLTFFVVGLAASGISLARAERPLAAPVVVEALLSWFMLFSIGAAYFYNFVFHVFFGELAASYIGWADSPFQIEVGFASLGMSLLGFLGFRGGFEMRLAAIVNCAAFLWGAAGGHVYQMATKGNYAPGNAGVIFWTDILMPVVALALLYAQVRVGRPARSR